MNLEIDWLMVMNCRIDILIWVDYRLVCVDFLLIMCEFLWEIMLISKLMIKLSSVDHI
jgi:hypothetical protein